MPDITPIWIDGYYETQAEAHDAMREGFAGVGIEGVPTPVLTLDQIEAWLNENNPAAPIVQSLDYVDGYDDGRRDMVTDLLAQVQAWKE